MQTKIKDTANNNRQWLVKMVKKGDSYGLNNCLIFDKDAVLIEFYDCNKGKEQFVSSYYADTILQIENNGLLLDGGVPEWKVSADVIKFVQRWAKENMN